MLCIQENVFRKNIGNRNNSCTFDIFPLFMKVSYSYDKLDQCYGLELRNFVDTERVCGINILFFPLSK